MSGFVALHIRPLVRQPLRAVLSISGVAVGIALLIAMLGLFSSMTTAADRLAALAGSADIEISAANDAGLPEGLTEQIAAVPGVKIVAPIVRANVIAARRPVLLLGTDGRLAQIGGSGIDINACIPKHMRSGEGVLVGPGLADVRTTVIATPTVSNRVNVLGRITCTDAHKINRGAFVIAPLPLAESLDGRAGRPDAIEVKRGAHTNQAAVIAAIGRVVAGRGVVATPKLAAHEAQQATKAFQQGTTVMVGLALVVGAFCVFNTVSMTALERRRELATLRAVGGSRHRLLRDFMSEMFVLGVVGSALGVVLGNVAGVQLIKRLPPLLVDTVGVKPTFVLGHRIVVVSIVLGTLVTLGAAIFPARKAVTVEPVEAMRSEGPTETLATTERRDVWILAGGLAVFGTGGVLCWTSHQNSVTIIGFSTITLGSLIAQYGGRTPIANAAAGFAALFGNSGRLASAAIARAPRRTWATVTAVSVAVITVVAMGGITSNQISTWTGPYHSMLRTDVWIGSSDTQQIPVNVRFPDAMVDRVRAVPGVASVVATQSSYTTIDKSRVLLQGVGGFGNSALFAALPLDIRRQMLDADHPVATATYAFAHQHHVHEGDTITLTTPTGPLRLPVVKIIDVIAPSQSGVVNMNLSVLQRAFERPGVTWIEAHADPGVTDATLKARIQTALKDSPVPAFVATGQEEYQGAKFAITQATQIITAMELAVFAGTALALGNALAISIIERKRELGIFRAIGTTRRQIGQMVLVEGVSVAAIGVGLGSFQGLMQHRIGDTAVQSLLEAKVSYAFTPRPLLGVAVAMVLTSMVTAVMPALRAAHTNMIEAIGYE